ARSPVAPAGGLAPKVSNQIESNAKAPSASRPQDGRREAFPRRVHPCPALQEECSMTNNEEDRSVLVSVLAGIGIGVLVGAVAGLLLAPKSGQETRDELGKSLSDLSDKVSELGRTVGQKVSSAVDRTRATMAQKLGEVTSEG